MSVLTSASLRAAVTLAKSDIPNPGTGTAPPGAADIKTILGWVAWVVCGLCVVGVLIVGGRMAVQHNRGEGGQHAAGLAYVFGACILVGAASGIVGALV